MTIIALLIILMHAWLIWATARWVRSQLGVKPYERPAVYWFGAGAALMLQYAAAWVWFMWPSALTDAWGRWLDHVVGPAAVTAAATAGFYALKRRWALATHRAFEADPVAEVTIDELSIVRVWNLAAERLFGWTAAEALGHSMPELIIPEESQPNHYAGMSRYLATGKSRRVVGRTIAVIALNKAGEQFPVEVSVQPREDNGKWHFDASIRRLLRL